MSIPQIQVTPCPRLSVPIERQQEIIEIINRKLRQQPRQGFCFMGSPGTGKTYLMKRLQEAVRLTRMLGGPRPITPRLFTLAEWQMARVKEARGDYSPLADSVSVEYIRTLASENAWGPYVTTRNTYHLFIDEFDSQPTSSEFAQSGLQTLVNALYENSPRLVPGNDQDFCQLVVAMNKTWPEFEAAYGTHVARRIDEMCVRIDFDRGTAKQPEPENPRLMPDDFDALFVEASGHV